METICNFSLPVNLNDGEDPDPKLADYEYSKMICETAESLETAILPEVITDGEITLMFIRPFLMLKLL